MNLIKIRNINKIIKQSNKNNLIQKCFFAKDPFFESIIDLLDNQEQVYKNIYFYSEKLPKELQEKVKKIYSVYNKKYQDREYKRKADLDNKIYLMHKAIEALPTNHLRELARIQDDTLFPKERFMLTTLPPPFKEYDDEIGEGYSVVDKDMNEVDLKELNVTVWDVIEAQQNKEE